MPTCQGIGFMVLAGPLEKVLSVGGKSLLGRSSATRTLDICVWIGLRSSGCWQIKCAAGVLQPHPSAGVTAGFRIHLWLACLAPPEGAVDELEKKNRL